jgi:uncharacterized membrane protein
MKLKVLVGALVVLLIINIAAIGSFLYLHHHAKHPPKQPDRAHRFAMRYVPEKDRAKFFRTARALRLDIGPLADETRGLEKQLIESMRQDPVPRAHVDSLLEHIARNRLEINRKATSRMIAMGDSLTADERGHMVDALLRFRNLGRADHWKE